jgi:hypothetical protein
MCLLILQEKIFSIQLTCTLLKKKGHNWKQYVDICTDGAKSMVGKTRRFIAHVKAIAQKALVATVIHRQSHPVKKIPNPLKTMLDDVMKFVSFIKSRPRNSRIFSALCDEMRASCTTLLLHTEVRWLSRGRVLICAFILRS